MAINSTFYLDAADLTLATSVYLDSSLLNLAPDGFYSDGTISREQSSGILLTAETCSACACINYEANGTGTLIYIDCTGEPRNYDMTSETLIFCAQEGSPSYTIGITLTDNGSCDILCREYQIDGEGSATFMDCFGNPGQAFSNEFFCAANGTVFGSGSIGIIGDCP